MLQESQRKRNELLLTFGVQKSFPGSDGVCVDYWMYSYCSCHLKRKKPSFLQDCFKDYSYMNLTYFSPVPTGHVLLFRFLFIKDQLNTHLLLKNIKSGNSVIKASAVLSHLVVSDSLRPHGLQPARLLCPWGFSRPEYWSGLPCPPPVDLPNPRINPRSGLQADSLPSEPPGNLK